MDRRTLAGMEILLGYIVFVIAFGCMVAFWIRFNRALRAVTESEKHLSIIAHLLTKQDRERQSSASGDSK